MTKKHEPEFTDYATADAWLKAGRNPDRRATRYGWNTDLRREPNGLVMYLHGEPILRYDQTPPAATALTPNVLPHVTRERLNMYMFGPRSLSVGVMGRISSVVPRRTLLHPRAPAIAVLVDDYTAGWRHEEGQVLTAQQAAWWDDMLSAWLDSIETLLRTNGVTAAPPDKPYCHECTQPSDLLNSRWAYFGGIEHLFAHVANREYIPEMITNITPLRGKLPAAEIERVITTLRDLVQANVPLHKGDS